MPIKIPPPPDMGVENQRLNRWLLEIQSILNSKGLIDPENIVELPATYEQVGENTTDIVNLIAIVNALGELVAVNTVNIATLQTQVLAVQGQITTLQARNQIYNGIVVPANGLGIVGDWYADTVGHNVYVKTGVATWTLIV